MDKVKDAIVTWADRWIEGAVNRPGMFAQSLEALENEVIILIQVKIVAQYPDLMQDKPRFVINAWNDYARTLRKFSGANPVWKQLDVMDMPYEVKVKRLCSMLNSFNKTIEHWIQKELKNENTGG